MSRTERGFVCPACGSTDINVLYSAPLSFNCKSCKVDLVDDNDHGIPVLTQEEMMMKRPGMFGLEVCIYGCGHRPHEGECIKGCEWCKPDPPHVYKFRVGRR